MANDDVSSRYETKKWFPQGVRSKQEPNRPLGPVAIFWRTEPDFLWWDFKYECLRSEKVSLGDRSVRDDARERSVQKPARRKCGRVPGWRGRCARMSQRSSWDWLFPHLSQTKNGEKKSKTSIFLSVENQNILLIILTCSVTRKRLKKLRVEWLKIWMLLVEISFFKRACNFQVQLVKCTVARDFH